MLGSIQNFFQSFLKTDEDDSREHSAHVLHLASAALMMELCKADQDIADSETEKLSDILEAHFSLDEEQLNTLMRLATEEAEASTSLYQFTSLFNEHYSLPEKLTLIRHLWEIAYADGNVDRYEDHLIRKVADLLYVSHSDFIKTKLAVRDSLES